MASHNTEGNNTMLHCYEAWVFENHKHVFDEARRWRMENSLKVNWSFFDRISHSRRGCTDPLSSTPLLRLKRCHACGQCHSSRVFTLLPVDTENSVQTQKVGDLLSTGVCDVCDQFDSPDKLVLCENERYSCWVLLTSASSLARGGTHHHSVAEQPSSTFDDVRHSPTIGAPVPYTPFVVRMRRTNGCVRCVRQAAAMASQ
jgi:ferredoxin